MFYGFYFDKIEIKSLDINVKNIMKLSSVMYLARCLLEYTATKLYRNRFYYSQVNIFNWTIIIKTIIMVSVKVQISAEVYELQMKHTTVWTNSRLNKYRL